MRYGDWQDDWVQALIEKAERDKAQPEPIDLDPGDHLTPRATMQPSTPGGISGGPGLSNLGQLASQFGGKGSGGFSFGGGGFGGGGAEAVGADGPSGGGLGGAGAALLWARLIGEGKKQEYLRLKDDPDDPLGNFGLAMLAPSGNQIMEDPKGMGLPTALGLPFLTPFTASDKAKQTKPEWSGLLGF